MKDTQIKNNQRLSSIFKSAFQFFFEAVREYFKEHNLDFKISYSNIIEYIMGYLSTDGDFDVEWRKPALS